MARIVKVDGEKIKSNFKKNIYIERLNFNPKLSRIQIQKGTVKECFHMLNNIIDEL